MICSLSDVQIIQFNYVGDGTLISNITQLYDLRKKSAPRTCFQVRGAFWLLSRQPIRLRIQRRDG